MQIDSLEDYLIEKLSQSFSNQEAIIMLIADYKNYCKKLCESNNGIFRSIANLMFVKNEYLPYTNSTAT